MRAFEDCSNVTLWCCLLVGFVLGYSGCETATSSWDADELELSLRPAGASATKRPEFRRCKKPDKGKCPPNAGSGATGGMGGAGSAGTAAAAGSAGAAAPSCTQTAAGCKLDLATATNRIDMVHDAKRRRLYITTLPSADAPGAVLRYDLASKQFLTPLLTEGQYLGIDLSPDEDVLAVADGMNDATNNWVHLIDLRSEKSEKFTFPLDFSEAGTFMPLFISNSTLLVSSRFAGSGWVPLRRVDLTTGDATVIASVRQDTMLVMSGDRTTVAWTESNISNGPVTRYDLRSGAMATVTTNWFTYEVCLSRDANQLSIPTYGGLYVFEGQTQRAIIGSYASVGPVACVYSPVSDLVYLAWYDYDRRHATLDVYDSNSLALHAVLEPAVAPSWAAGNHAFGFGRLRIARDGTLVFLGVEQGVAIYQAERAQ